VGLKTAAFLAFIGMLFLTVLDAAGFLRDFGGFLRDTVAALAVLESAIHLFAALTLLIFLFVVWRREA
jgi:hypothetical protein